MNAKSNRRAGRVCVFFAPLLLVTVSGAQDQLWIRQMGTAEDEQVYALESDGVGGVFVGGYTSGSWVKPSLGWADAILARYDQRGNQVWLRQFGDEPIGHDIILDLALDSLGNLFVVGWTSGDLGRVNPAGGYADPFIACFSDEGEQIWLRQFGSATHDYAVAVAPDGVGGAFVCGHTYGELGSAHTGDEDAFIAHFDAQGNQTWVRQFGTIYSDTAVSLATDEKNGVYVCGTLEGNALFSRFIGVSYLDHYDINGRQLWSRSFGNSGDYTVGIATDGDGGVYVGGSTGGHFGGTSAGKVDAYLIRFDSTGSQVWIRQFGTTLNDDVYDVASDRNDGVLISGSTLGTFVGNVAYGRFDGFVALYNREGNMKWVRQFGGLGTDRSSAVTADGSGGAFAGGFTLSSLGGAAAGEDDMFVTRFGNKGCYYGNCDVSTGIGTLDIYDFLCFQNAFVNADPYACDCDASTGNGVCDVFDFLCFQDAFVAGCP